MRKQEQKEKDERENSKKFKKKKLNTYEAWSVTVMGQPKIFNVKKTILKTEIIVKGLPKLEIISSKVG